MEQYQDTKDYYGKELQSTEDLQTNACCTMTKPPKYIIDALNNVHEEVLAKYYGCGITIPTQLNGLDVLDLGSGSGRDCYIAAQLVGEEGSVTGIDMTDEQLAVANKYIDHHRSVFNYTASNVKFIKGNIDYLSDIQYLKSASFDLIVSNCVLNLSQNKAQVLKDVFRLLKEGGEFYFSDVYADRRIPQDLQDDKLLWGECLSGALYWNDFLRLAQAAGFIDPRVVESKPITIDNEDLENRVGDIQFYSVTYRLFKMELESDCEDYGEAVVYKGGIMESPYSMTLDEHHIFPKGKVMTVCGNTYDMLYHSRYREFFDFIGNREIHYGIFEGCGGNIPFTDINNTESSSCC